MKTTKRFEYKYKITYADYFKIKPLLATMLIHDQHGSEDAYPVHSVYLDDIYFSGAADKAFGNHFHKKYRIRYYHDSTERKLELKEKVGDEATKYATPISEAIYNAIIDFDLDVLEQHFTDPLIRRFTIDFLRFHYSPICNIVYQREAYRDSLNNLRITFDHSLEVARFDEENIPDFLKLIHSSHLILEVKYEHYIPKQIAKLLHHISLQQLAVSKYFLGFAQITP